MAVPKHTLLGKVRGREEEEGRGALGQVTVEEEEGEDTENRIEKDAKAPTLTISTAHYSGSSG